MTERTLIHGQDGAVLDDIRDHGYAVLQTRIERVPARYRSTQCAEPDGCPRPATLVTFAIDEVVEGEDGGFHFVRNQAGAIAHIPVCDEHRCEASHDLYFALTERQRPDGIRAFDVPGQHLSWT